MKHLSSFATKITDKTATIAIIGLGYVGLPLALGFNKAGFNVLGIDINQSLVSQLAAGKSHIIQFSDETISDMNETSRFLPTTDFSKLSEANAILICVPTPLTEHQAPDLSYVEKTAQNLAPHLQAGQIVILESTTYPGTTREVVLPILEEFSGLKANEDFYLAYSPEREDPGNPNYGAANTPKVVGSMTKEGKEMARLLYEALVGQVVLVSNTDTAEAVKLTENIFRSVNIAMVNELKQIYDSMGIDVWEVIDAAATKPFGFMPFYPGPGLGGHCIPIDPFYLTWKAKEYGHHTRFIELAGQINTSMPMYVANKLSSGLSSQKQLAMNGSRVLVVGIAYKKNVNDMRESPALVLIELLKESGVLVDYFDPFVPEIPPTREHPELAGTKSIEWQAEKLKMYDAAIVVTDHSNINWQVLIDACSLIVDTRNALSDWSNEHAHKIIKA